MDAREVVAAALYAAVAAGWSLALLYWIVRALEE